MMQIVNNIVAIIVMVIVAVISNWQIGLVGTGNLLTLMLLLSLIAGQMQKLNKHALKKDLTGQVGCFSCIFNSFPSLNLFHHTVIIYGAFGINLSNGHVF